MRALVFLLSLLASGTLGCSCCREPFHASWYWVEGDAAAPPAAPQKSIAQGTDVSAAAPMPADARGEIHLAIVNRDKEPRYISRVVLNPGEKGPQAERATGPIARPLRSGEMLLIPLTDFLPHSDRSPGSNRPHCVLPLRILIISDCRPAKTLVELANGLPLALPPGWECCRQAGCPTDPGGSRPAP